MKGNLLFLALGITTLWVWLRSEWTPLPQSATMIGILIIAANCGRFTHGKGFCDVLVSAGFFVGALFGTAAGVVTVPVSFFFSGFEFSGALYQGFINCIGFLTLVTAGLITSDAFNENESDNAEKQLGEDPS